MIVLLHGEKMISSYGVMDETPKRNPIPRRSQRQASRTKIDLASDFATSPDVISETQVFVPNTQTPSIFDSTVTQESQVVIPETQDDSSCVCVSDCSDAELSSLLLTQASSSTDSGEPIRTVITSRVNDPFNLELNGHKGIRLFRGVKEPLSAFYHHPLRYEGRNYISAEQAYQHQKFVHHRLSRPAHDELLRCRTSHSVKRVSVKWLPCPSSSWQEIRFIKMEEICSAKLKQCRAFRLALLQNTDNLLVHNTESDGVWGCGLDLRGHNMMGQILMSIRDRRADYNRDFPPLPVARQQLPKISPPSLTRKRVLVIGNSNARGLSQGLCDRGLDSTAFVYPGQTVSYLQGRLVAIVEASTDHVPDAIVLHAGDIEARDKSTSAGSVSSSITELLQQLSARFANARIVLSGLPTACGNKQLSRKISEINIATARFCQDTKNCVYLCNKNARLRQDGIHLTQQAKDFVARTVACHVKQCL